MDLCSSGLIIGRRRYELAGLDCQDRGAPQVSEMRPVAETEWCVSGLINPADAAGKDTVTGKRGAGRPASPNRRELNPDSLANHKAPNNTCSIVLAQMFVLPPKSRVVSMGRMSRGRQCQDLPKTVVVEPVPTRNPGVYFAQVVSDVFVRTGHDCSRLSDAHHSSLIDSTGEKEPGGVNEKSQGESDEKGENQGVPEEKGRTGCSIPWVVGRPKQCPVHGTLLLHD